MQTHFNNTPIKGRTTRGQIALYAFAGLFSLWLAVQGGSNVWAHRHDANPPTDPNSFRGGLDTIFQSWKRDVWAPQPTPAPTAQRTQAAPVSTTQAPAATATETPYQASDEMMSEWKHIPPGQESNYEAYRQRVAAQQPTPAPKPFQPYMPPEAMPDPIAAKHAQWQGLHDSYVTQIRGRLAAAKTDAEKGQIQRDIKSWQAQNPEPPKPAAAPNENEIPIH